MLLILKFNLCHNSAAQIVYDQHKHILILANKYMIMLTPYHDNYL